MSRRQAAFSLCLGKRQSCGGFTLLELLVVMGIIALLVAAMMPSVIGARDYAKAAICATRLRHMGFSLSSYTLDNRDTMFPLSQTLPDGKLWWFGFEANGGPASEGDRILDRQRGRLWQYYQKSDGIEICPSFDTGSANYKPKYTTNWTCYGVPLKLMSQTKPSRTENIHYPTETLAFADAAQINFFQPPASPTNPMFEQWYYISRTEQTVHYVHHELANVVMFDGHVQQIEPMFGLNTLFEEAPVGRPPSYVFIQEN